MTARTFDLATRPVHLGLGARIQLLEPIDGTIEWYERYGAAEGVAEDGAEGRLVSMHTFTEPWDSWEMHPSGDELVLCLEGNLTLIQETDGASRAAELRAGEAIVNAPGTWHTADIDGSARALFITAGEGTVHRPR